MDISFSGSFWMSVLIKINAVLTQGVTVFACVYVTRSAKRGHLNCQV